MSGYSREQTSDVTTTSTEQQTEKGSGQGSSNQAAMDNLQDSSSNPPPINLGTVNSGSAFSSAASTALKSIVPSPGSFASLAIGGKLPIYKTAGFAAFLEPKLELQATYTNDRKYEVMFSSELGLRAEAGTDGGDSWWPTFLAYFKGYIKGSIKITGDSPQEIFNEFMLTVRMVVDEAAKSAQAPDSIREGMANAVMSEAQRERTIDQMGKGDGVTVSIGGGVEGGVKTSVGDGKASGEVQFSKTIQDENNDNRLEVDQMTSIILNGELEVKKWPGFKTTAGVTFAWKNGQFDGWEVAFGGAFEFDAAKFKELFVGITWAQDLVNGLANMIKTVGDKSSKLNGTELYGMIRNISITDNLVQYSVLGKQLQSAATSPNFESTFGQKAETNIQVKGGWSADKGAFIGLGIGTSKTWSLGEAGKTPIFIEAKTGDTILTLDASSKEGGSVGT